MILLLPLVVGYPGKLPAQQDASLLRKLQKKFSNTEQRNKALIAGQERALICSYCHGGDGNSVKPEVPNLAGQNPDYLLEQIGRFANGERKDFVMNSLASKFTDDDQINLAIYYSEQKVKPEKTNSAMAKLGQKIYIANCQACHGKRGRGNPGYARLAGQKQAYIGKTLRRFRNNATKPADKNRRSSSVMEPIAGKLGEQDILNLAAYIASI